MRRRGKKRKSVDVNIEQLEEKVRKQDADKGGTKNVSVSGNAQGITVEEMTEKMRARYRLDDDVIGVRVTKVSVKSDASGKLRKGDIILEVAQELIESPEDFTKKMKVAADLDEPIILLINRGGVPRFYSVEPSS